jgi:Spy/CpxP family protein refolding chaperone
MKKISILVVMVAAIFTASAQIQRNVVKKPTTTDSTQKNQATAEWQKPNRKALLKELDLTKEQKLKIKDVRSKNQADEDAINSDPKLTDDEKKQKIRQIKKQHLLQVQALLTNEQKEKFKKMKEGNKEQPE